MRPSVTSIERDLRRLTRGDVEFDRISRHLYATDGSPFQIEPLGVVAPRDQEDVSRLADYAAQNGIPLVPRGAGSGLAGAAVGAGIQVDFTRYMNRILEVAEDGSWARVQPGVIMGELNQRVKPLGTFFAPNPSSENYCSLGGMMANNSSGSRSVAYGDTKDHVRSVSVVLNDGEVFTTGSLRRADTALRDPAGQGAGGEAITHLVSLLEEKQDVITASMPRVLKNASGYRIETVLDGEQIHPQRFFIGSEGTLGMLTEATLNLVPLPGQRAIAMAYFPTVFAAGQTVAPILTLKPTSLEIMDSNFLNFVRENDPSVNELLPQDVDTALLVEFEAGQEEELLEKLGSLDELLSDGPALEVRRAIDASEQAKLWKVRKSAVPLLQKIPGPRRIAEFIEDVTVHPEVLAGYMDTLSGILDKKDVKGILYGHAGDGNIHTRPLLDLKDSSDLRLMQTIMDDVMEYVLEIRGTPSGEHGDGLIRAGLVPRVYGEEVFGLFREIKNTLDPAGIMNPGKKVVHPAETGGVARNLRYGGDYYTHEQRTLLHFPDNEYEREIEMCHGCAQCKSTVATTMCPTYKATRREHASPRAKANLLRNVINGNLDPVGTYWDDRTKEVTDYCLECGMCAVECPSNVNIPKLMLEAKSRYRKEKRAEPADLALSYAETATRSARMLAPLVNSLMDNKLARELGDRVVGVDRRRQLPKIASQSYSQMVAARREDGGAGARGDSAPEEGKTVSFFYDIYANYNEPELAIDIERALAAHGFRVLHPKQKGSGVPEMLYGYVDRARAAARFNLDRLLPQIRGGALAASGEPTASFALKVHYPDYLNRPEATKLSKAARDLGELLATAREEGEGTGPERGSPPLLTEIPMRVAYHEPCHLKAQQVKRSFKDILTSIPGMELTVLDAGCCGMAGTFGMRSGTYDFSLETGQPLFDRVKEVRPDVIATECSTCCMQLMQATGLDVIHPVRLLNTSCGLEGAEHTDREKPKVERG